MMEIKDCDFSQMLPVTHEKFDAEHDLRLEAEVRAKVNAEDCNDAERKLAAAERQVGELRKENMHLRVVTSWEGITKVTIPFGPLCAVLDERDAIKYKLDTAMGLLARCLQSEIDWMDNIPEDVLQSDGVLVADLQALLNTTSTEGKDHE